VRFHDGDLNPRFFNWPSLSMYLLSGVYGLLFGAAPGGVPGAFARSPGTFYLVGRLVTAAFGAATVALVHAAGRAAYGRAVGGLAALFLAVDLLHVRDSHWVTTDVPLACLVTLASLHALRYWRDGRAADAGLAGLVSGLATAMKYPGGLAFLGLVVAHAGRAPAAGPWSWRRVAGGRMVAAAALAVAGFVAGTPYALLTPRAFLGGVLDEVREVHSVQFGNEAEAGGYLFHLLHSLPEAMGWPLAALALAGTLVVLVRRDARGAILLAFPLPYFVVIGTWSARFERYAIPLLPFLALFAAVALVAGARRLARRGALGRGPWPAVALATAVALLVAPELGRVLEYHALLARPDTRVLAAAWVERVIPAGTRIALEPYSLALPVASDQLRDAAEVLAASLEQPLPAGRRGRAGAGGPDGYWLVRLDTYDLAALRRAGVEYVVLSGFVYQRHRQACDRHPEPCRFYRALEARAELVFSVSPGADDGALRVGDIYSPLTRLAERRHPGPPLRIYRLPPGTA
jgi:hypothetical protein